MLGLVPGIVLVLSPEHVQETVHDSHALVEALRWQLGEVAPRGSSFTRVPPQDLNGEGKGQQGRYSFCWLVMGGTYLTAERSLCERWSAANGEKSLLGPAHLRASGLQGVLLEGQQVVVHGIHQQAVTLRVHHHPRHWLDLADELACWDCLKANVRQEFCCVRLTRGVKVEPLHGQLERARCTNTQMKKKGIDIYFLLYSFMHTC